MGSWGIKALESDEGLDIVGLFKAFVETHPKLELKQLISHYQAAGFLATDKTEIDYLYDTTAIALSEIYLEYLQTGQFITGDGPLDIHVFTATKNDLLFLMTCVDDIIQERPDADGEREYADLHKETPGWTDYVRNIFERLNSEQVKLNR